MGFVKTKISRGLTHVLSKCDSGEESRGLFSPSGHGFAGGSCGRSTPSLGDIGIHLLLRCPSSFQLCLAVCLYWTETDFKCMYLFLIAKRTYILTSCCVRSLKAAKVLLLLIFLWPSKELGGYIITNYINIILKNPVQNRKLLLLNGLINSTREHFLYLVHLKKKKKAL